MTAVQCVLLVLVAVAGGLVALARDPLRQAVLAGIFGLILALLFFAVQAPDVAHTVAFAEGTFNPVAQMGNPDCLKLFTKDELDAIQWDSLDEEMARSVEYDVVPDYDKLLEIMNSAKREVSGG